MCILVFLFMCGRICPEKYSCRTDFPDKALFTKPDGKWNYGQLAVESAEEAVGRNLLARQHITADVAQVFIGGYEIGRASCRERV